MKEFKANLELEEILLRNGFIDTTEERDKIKGKKSFKKTKNAQKEIYFDYINIRVLPGGRESNRIELNEQELKFIFLFFKLKSIDFKELVSDGRFDFNKIKQGIDSLKHELKFHREFNGRHQRQNKIERILNEYKEIVIL